MHSIDGTTISLTRGDTLIVKLDLMYSDGTQYIPHEGDQIRFAMKKTYNDRNCIIIKDIPTDTLILKIDSEDTKKLPQPSKYIYDIQLTQANGNVDTFITEAKFIIEREVE